MLRVKELLNYKTIDHTRQTAAFRKYEPIIYHWLEAGSLCLQPLVHPYISPGPFFDFGPRHLILNFKHLRALEVEGVADP